MRRSGLVGLVGLALAGACTSAAPPPAQTEASPPPPPAAQADPTPQPAPQASDALEGPFTLEVRSVSGPMFRYQFIANHMGSFWWVEAVGDDLRLLEGKMTDEELANLRDSLSPAFFDLDEVYVEPGVHDGSQVTMRLTGGGNSHRVVADNKTPPEMGAIKAQVSAIMTSERRAELAKAPMAQPEDLDPTLVY